MKLTALLLFCAALVSTALYFGRNAYDQCAKCHHYEAEAHHSIAQH